MAAAYSPVTGVCSVSAPIIVIPCAQLITIIGTLLGDPSHYVPVLARNRGASRNGALFKNWLLSASLERMRRKLQYSDHGDRQMVKAAATADRRFGFCRGSLRQTLAESVYSPDVGDQL